VRIPVAGHIGQETGQDGQLEGIDEVKKPDTVEGSVKEEVW
jgi:hypothetical protein